MVGGRQYVDVGRYSATGNAPTSWDPSTKTIARPRARAADGDDVGPVTGGALYAAEGDQLGPLVHVLATSCASRPPLRKGTWRTSYPFWSSWRHGKLLELYSRAPITTFSPAPAAELGGDEPRDRGDGGDQRDVVGSPPRSAWPPRTSGVRGPLGLGEVEAFVGPAVDEPVVGVGEVAAREADGGSVQVGGSRSRGTGAGPRGCRSERSRPQRTPAHGAALIGFPDWSTPAPGVDHLSVLGSPVDGYFGIQAGQVGVQRCRLPVSPRCTWGGSAGCPSRGFSSCSFDGGDGGGRRHAVAGRPERG